MHKLDKRERLTEKSQMYLPLTFIIKNTLYPEITSYSTSNIHPDSYKAFNQIKRTQKLKLNERHCTWIHLVDLKMN